MRDRVREYLDDPTDAGRSELADLYAMYRQRYQPLNADELVEVKAVRRRDDDNDHAVDEATGERAQSGVALRRWRASGTDPSWWSLGRSERDPAHRPVVELCETTSCARGEQ